MLSDGSTSSGSLGSLADGQVVAVTAMVEEAHTAHGKDTNEIALGSKEEGRWLQTKKRQ